MSVRSEILDLTKEYGFIGLAIGIVALPFGVFRDIFIYLGKGVVRVKNLITP